MAKRRLAEVQECARILGIETEVLDIHDGELEPNLENRKKVAVYNLPAEAGYHKRESAGKSSMVIIYPVRRKAAGLAGNGFLFLLLCLCPEIFLLLMTKSNF